MIATQEAREECTEVEVQTWEQLKADSIERWPEQRARIRAIRARMNGKVAARDLVEACVAEELFTPEDMELFIRRGIERRVLNAVPDMRTGRRG